MCEDIKSENTVFSEKWHAWVNQANRNVWHFSVHLNIVMFKWYYLRSLEHKLMFDIITSQTQLELQQFCHFHINLENQGNQGRHLNFLHLTVSELGKVRRPLNWYSSLLPERQWCQKRSAAVGTFQFEKPTIQSIFGWWKIPVYSSRQQLIKR